MLKDIFVAMALLLIFGGDDSFAQTDVSSLAQENITIEVTNTENEILPSEVQENIEKIDEIKQSVTEDNLSTAETSERRETETESGESEEKAGTDDGNAAEAANESATKEDTVAPIEVLPSEVMEKTRGDEDVNEPSDASDADNFMVEYFNEVDAAEAQDKAALKAQEDAFELMKTKPTMVTISEEQKELLLLAERRRKQRERELQKKQDELKAEENSEAVQSNISENDEISANAESVDLSIEGGEETRIQEEEDVSETHDKAPFGLFWGLSKEKTEELEFAFRPAKLADQTNVYVVENLKHPQQKFATVIAVFGEQNHLNAIYAESAFVDDTPQADKALKMYNQYYAALKKKYGNAKEYFKANKYEEQIEVPNLSNEPIKDTAPKAENENEKAESEENTAHVSKTVVKTVTKENPRGNDNFLQELQAKKASLLATFGDENIKVTLAVEVNEQLQSRITLDYENLSVQQQDKEAALNDLMDDL